MKKKDKCKDCPSPIVCSSLDRCPLATVTTELPNLPALSIRQPWAWLILNAGKDIENRSWRTDYRGQFLIHAAKGMTRREYDDVRHGLPEIGRSAAASHLPEYHELERGGIVGMAEIVGCVAISDSAWFSGKWGFVLRNVQALPFTPCRGILGFFRPQIIAQ